MVCFKLTRMLSEAIGSLVECRNVFVSFHTIRACKKLISMGEKYIEQDYTFEVYTWLSSFNHGVILECSLCTCVGRFA